MPRHPFHSDAELSDTIRALMAETGTVPSYDAVRAALGGPVSRDHLRNALHKARLTQIAPPPAASALSNASPSPAHPQAIAREVAALILRSLASRAGYRAPAFAEIKVAVQRSLAAQSGQQHDRMIAPYIERIGQFEAEATVRAA